LIIILYFFLDKKSSKKVKVGTNTVRYCRIALITFEVLWLQH
jgi:hypothetical protein